MNKWLLVIMLLIGVRVNAQLLHNSLPFERITTEDGLSHNNVYAIIQSNDGYMWFGMQNGLMRYDGTTFKHYYHDPENDNSLVFSNFGKILEDHKGNLWLGTFGGGLDKYDVSQNKYIHCNLGKDNSINIGNKLIMWIHQDHKQRIWIATLGNGIKLFDEKTNTFKTYEHQINNANSLSHNYVRHITHDNYGYIWIATENGLNRFDPENEQFVHYHNIANNKNSLSSNIILSLVYAGNDILWIGTQGGGLNCLNICTNDVVRYEQDVSNSYSLSDADAHFLFIDSYKTLWIGTNNGGLNRFDAETKTFTHFTFDPNDPKSLSHNRVTFLCEDASRNLWVATQGGGVNKLNIKPRKFTAYRHNPLKKNSLPHPNVMDIVQASDSMLWIATDGGGVSRFDIRTGTFENIQHNPDDVWSISSSRVWTLLIDNKNNLWVGTQYRGLNRASLNSVPPYKFDRFVANVADSTALLGDLITSLHQDKNGTVWIGTQNGLNSVVDNNAKQIQFKRHRLVEKTNSWTTNNYISVIYSYDKNNLWVGTVEEGVFKISTSGEKFQYKFDVNNQLSINNNHILSITTDYRKRVWVGTISGLNRLNEQTGTFTRIPRSIYAAEEDINSITEDIDGNLWIGTSKGLSRFNPATYERTNYDKTDGLPEISFNRDAAIINNNGMLVMGTIGGMITFEPTHIYDNDFKPPVKITDFKIFNQSRWFAEKSRLRAKEPSLIELEYTDYLISFDFAAFDYTNSHKNQYSYMLENFDPDWIDALDRRFVSYTSLPPGEYVFRVRASNDDNVWNYAGTSLRVVMNPPFWLTYWFFTLVVLFVASAIFVYIKLRTRKLRYDKQLLEVKVEERTLQLAEQSKVLAEQNEEIRASIRYALNIQRALLMVSEDIDKMVENFIVYRPKDIVSGDFYWFTRISSPNDSAEKLFFAVADCTGHGVPGAFMSLIGNRLLQDIVKNNQTHDPAHILTLLNNGVRDWLKQEQTDNDDGMDVALCLIERQVHNHSEVHITFAGARRPLFFYSSQLQKVEQLKATRKPVGGKPSSLDKINFQNEHLLLYANDILYLTSDGMIDQHGANQKRIGTKGFVELLRQQGHLNMQQQKANIEQMLDIFLESEFQRDDITILGIKI